MKFYLFIVSLCSFCFIHCTTMADSRKSAQFTQKMDNVFFMIETVRLTPHINVSFIQSLERELDAALKGKKIAVSYVPYAPVSLVSKEDIALKIAQSQSTYVMRLNGNIDFNAMRGCFFDVQINPQNSDAILWRCSLERPLTYSDQIKSVKETVNILIAQMEKDGIL